jgi:hypothetical protein
MNKIQRGAWMSLLFIAPLWLIFGQLPVLIIYLQGPSFIHLFSFACGTTIGGLTWLLVLFSDRIFKKKTKIEFDERDKLILIRSALVAYVVLWLYFVAACIFAWLYVAPKCYISINVMPMVVIGGIVVFHVVQGATTLILYGWGGKNGE